MGERILPIYNGYSVLESRAYYLNEQTNRLSWVLRRVYLRLGVARLLSKRTNEQAVLGIVLFISP